MTDSVIRAKVDPNLKDAFYELCKNQDITPSQAIRQFMRTSLTKGIQPNELTVDTLNKSQAGDDIYQASDAEDLFKQLGI
jgi:DNA-damage-inducible protein J